MLAAGAKGWSARETWPQLLASPAGATLLPVSRVISPAIRSARVSTECGTRLASGPLKYSVQQWAPPLPSHLRPRGSPLEWSLAAGQPRAAPGYLHNLCSQGATPPLPPSRSVPVITAGQSAAPCGPEAVSELSRPGRLRAVKRRRGPRAISSRGTLLQGLAGRPSLGWDGEVGRWPESVGGARVAETWSQLGPCVRSLSGC